MSDVSTTSQVDIWIKSSKSWFSFDSCLQITEIWE